MTSADKLLNDWTWFHGPKWLWKPESEWPNQPDIHLIRETEVESEVTSFAVEYADISCVNALILHYSSWYRLKRAVAIYRKFIEHLQKRNKSQTMTYELSVFDIQSAETAILRTVQKEAYPDEMKMVNTLDGQNRLSLPKQSSILKLDPMFDSDLGLLRVGGRLSRACIPEGSKHPILIPKKHHVTTLILRDTHEQLGHAGRNHVLGIVREKYWITQAQAAVRSVLSKCIKCRRKANVGEQKMADLPVERTRTDPPFTYCGLDFFGPFLIKQGRKRMKYYGVMFTCLSSRAIHLEVAASLNVDSCINAIRRMIARRGPISQIRCDNGTNFVGSERELREAIEEMDNGKIKENLQKHAIEWIMNPPAGSSFGGVFERQIRTTRKILSSLSRDAGDNLDIEAFETLMCEVEAIVNSRPLTTVSSDPNDLNVLTPSQILTLKTRAITPPPGKFQKDDMYLRKRWRHVQHISDQFWKRWKREYLATLQERSKWQKPRRNMSQGDVVLMKDERVHRNYWPMARIVETEPDRHGYVRAVKVKSIAGVYRRPVNKLILLIPTEEQKL